MFADPSSVKESTIDVGAASPGATHFFLVRWCFPGWPTNLMPFVTETLTWTCKRRSSTGTDEKRRGENRRDTSEALHSPLIDYADIIPAWHAPPSHRAFSSKPPKARENILNHNVNFPCRLTHASRAPRRIKFHSSSNFHRGLGNAAGSFNCSLSTCHKS